MSTKLESFLINGDHCAWVIASTEEDARAECVNYGYDADVRLIDAGWAQDVGWDRDRYGYRRDFREATGMKSWWEIGVAPPADGNESRKVRRAWEIV